MKKILSLIAAGAMALGLIGCSGDLHDKEISPLYIIGTMWDSRTALTVVDDTTQSIKFTYDDTKTGWDAKNGEVHFKFTKTGDSDWSDDFGGSDTETIKLTLNDDFVETHSRKNESLPDTAHIVMSGLDNGKEYTIVMKFTAASNKVEVKAEGEEPIPEKDLFLVAGSDITKLDMPAKNVSYTISVTGDGSAVKLFDGKDLYGITVAGAIPTDETTLVKDGKAMTLPADSKKYIINVTVSEDGDISLVSIPALYNYKYDLKYLCSNYGNYDLTWTADGDNMKAVVTIPAGKAKEWGGDDLAFGITNNTSWGTKFTGGVLGLYNAVELTLGAGENNSACVNPSTEAITVTIVASETNVTAAVTQASVDANALCFKDSLAYVCSNFGNYPIVWKTTTTAGKYQGVVTIPAGATNVWSGDADDNVQFGVTNNTDWGVKYTGATLATAGTPVALTKGAGDNNTAATNPSADAVVITLIADATTVTAQF